MKTFINWLSEESGIGGVRGMGYVTGDPNGSTSYTDNNIADSDDRRAAQQKFIQNAHLNLHTNKGPGDAGVHDKVIQHGITFDKSRSGPKG